ncbi:phosphodiesterase [Mesorhizobium loti]|nr:phosphodiesterase [Mesorhizobium loti]PLP60834.1 phosphodiesterase [Mesorhizobium loti]
MIKIIQITDIHLVPPGTELRRLDPERRFRDCLEQIEGEHGDAMALVVSGDLTDNGDRPSYELLRDIIADYRLPPVYLTLGNHDRRETFSHVFPSAMDTSTGSVQAQIDLGSQQGIVLDTWMEGKHAGALCRQRLDWLAERLQLDPRPALLFMHHAPLRVALKRIDQIPLLSDNELWETLAPFRERIRHLFFGHMHRNVSGSWRGIPFTVLSGTTHHGMLDFQTELIRDTILDPFYAVILVDERDIVVHFSQVRLHWEATSRGPGPTNAALREKSAIPA